MAGEFKTNVTDKDIEIDKDGAVHIRSQGLLNTFIHSSPHALEKLARDIAPVPIDSVSVDDLGRIVIEDANFRKAIESKMKEVRAAVAVTNVLCNNAYHCGKV